MFGRTFAKSGATTRGIEVNKCKAFLAAAATFVAFSSAASAGGLAAYFTICVAKYADPKASATVVLDCNAADGKLNGCKVVEAPTPSKGFDKAALCVAEALPVGTRTGDTKFPIKFEPQM